MGFTKKLRETFGLSPDRVIERGRGCWNCVSFSCEKAQDLWWNKARNATLEKGIQLAITSPQGEKDERVLAIRKGVPEMDRGMTVQAWGICAKEKSGANFTASTFLCPDGWSGKQGASIAASGIDDKPSEEILDNLRTEGETN